MAKPFDDLITGVLSVEPTGVALVAVACLKVLDCSVEVEWIVFEESLLLIASDDKEWIAISLWVLEDEVQAVYLVCLYGAV